MVIIPVSKPSEDVKLLIDHVGLKFREESDARDTNVEVIRIFTIIITIRLDEKN